MRALYASSGPHAPLGDPEIGAPKRWPVLHGTGLPFPLCSWLVEGAELEAADALEAFLAGSGAPHELARDVEFGRVLSGVLRSGGGPAQMLAEVQRLANERALPEIVPVTVDRSDPLATVALDVCAGADGEEAPARLLGDHDARALLTFVAKHVPPALRHRLSGHARAAAARDGQIDVRLLRAAAIEAATDLATAAEEQRVRDALEAPTRAAAARLASLAADARARLAAELDAAEVSP